MEDNSRKVRPGRAAGGHTRPPRFVQEYCSDSEKQKVDETCDYLYEFRTTTGECNNPK
jgi:hypothetical protein